MSLDEEIRHTIIVDAIDEAIKNGDLITREEYQRQMANYQRQMAEKDFENSVRFVRALIKMGHSSEDGISEIPEDHREAVIRIVTEEPVN